MNILHFSDTHLGCVQMDHLDHNGVNYRENDFYRAFEFVVDYAIEHRPDYIIHTGDLFHRPSPSNRALTQAVELIKRLSMAHIPTIIIAGNHSVPKTRHTPPILQIFKNIEHIYPICDQKYEVIQFDHIAFHGIPHINDPSVAHEQILKLKPIPNIPNILMMHTSVGQPYKEDLYGDTQLSSQYYPLVDQFDYFALGHWHNYQQVKALKNAWYAGSTERVSESEINKAKGFLYLDTNRLDSPKFIEIPVRKWYKIEITNCYQYSVDDIKSILNDKLTENPINDAFVHISLLDSTISQTFEIPNLWIRELYAHALDVTISRKYHNSDTNSTAAHDVSVGNLLYYFDQYITDHTTDAAPDTVERLKAIAKHYFALNE